MKPHQIFAAGILVVLLAVSFGGLAVPAGSDAPPASQPATDARISALETEVAALRAEVAHLATADVRVPDLDVTLDMFLDLPGIPGGSPRDGHEDEIEAFGWTWGTSNPTGDGPLARDIVLLKQVDMASVPMFFACANGTIIPEATLAFRRTIEGETSDYLIFDLEDVRITSVEHGIGGEHELVTLSASRIQITFDDSIVAGWDFAANEST